MSPLELTWSELLQRKTLTDAEVRVVAERRGGGERVEVRAAQGEASTPRDYGALLDLPEAGSWHVTVLIEGAYGAGQAGFDLLVPSGGRVGGWIGAYLPFGGLLLLVAAYLLLTRPRPSRET